MLILHQYFRTPYEGGALRSYYLAKALVDSGTPVVVVTAYNESTTRREIIDGIEVYYLPISYENRFGFYKRSLAFLRFILGSIRLVSSIKKDISLCYAISVPLTIGFVARWLKWTYKIPYIFEVGDLWPDAPIQIGAINNFFLKKMLYLFEASTYQQAKSIVALSPTIQSTIQQRCPSKIIHLIPNMSDVVYYQPEVKSKVLEDQFGVTGKFVVSYIGALGLANGLDFLLECARACQKASLPVHFFVCGDGAMADHLKNTAVNLHLTNITILPFQNREGVKRLLNITDATMICYKPLPILETGSPNKYFDGLAAGKIIITNFGGWIKNEIESEHCGFSLSPNSPQNIVEKLNPFIEDTSLKNKYQQAARNLAEKKYSRVQLCKEWTNIITTKK